MMATRAGARTLGVEHDIGSLEVGKRADICAFDLGKAHVTVPNRPVAALVFSAHGTDVDTVIINGELRLRGGALVGFDAEQEVLTEARRRAREAIERAGIALPGTIAATFLLSIGRIFALKFPRNFFRLLALHHANEIACVVGISFAFVLRHLRIRTKRPGHLHAFLYAVDFVLRRHD